MKIVDAIVFLMCTVFAFYSLEGIDFKIFAKKNRNRQIMAFYIMLGLVFSGLLMSFYLLAKNYLIF